MKRMKRFPCRSGCQRRFRSEPGRERHEETVHAPHSILIRVKHCGENGQPRYTSTHRALLNVLEHLRYAGLISYGFDKEDMLVAVPLKPMPIRMDFAKKEFIERLHSFLDDGEIVNGDPEHAILVREAVTQQGSRSVVR